MDPLSVIPLVSSIFEIGKAVIGARDEAKRIELVAQLNEKTLAVQAIASQAFGQVDLLRDEKAALLQTKIDLEALVREMTDRKVEIEKYVLERLPTGAVVRRRHEAGQPVEPPMYICANCATRGEVTFLQPTRGGTALACPCGHEPIPAKALAHAPKPRQGTKSAYLIRQR